jgi:predicted DCC family thiol-disulfide oxidoreductase YuxK
MSIGLVIRYTYDETCELCEKVALFIKKLPAKFNVFFTRIGYARAASELARMGKYEEAKALMTEKENLK